MTFRMADSKLKSDQEIMKSLGETPNRTIDNRFSITRQLSSLFGPGIISKDENSPNGSNVSIWSGDSGFSDKRDRVKTDGDLIVDLSQEIIDLAGDTWPIQESLMFR